MHVVANSYICVRTYRDIYTVPKNLMYRNRNNQFKYYYNYTKYN